MNAAQESFDNAKFKEAAREKYWTELSQDEKIERTRQVVKSALQGISEALDRLNKSINRVEHQFNHHFHAGNDLAYKQSFGHGQPMTVGEFDRQSIRSTKQRDQDLFF